MQAVTIPQITKQLRKLPPDKLVVVYDFVSYLTKRDLGPIAQESSGTYQTMLASESVLRRDWDQPEEDAAWANL